MTEQGGAVPLPDAWSDDLPPLAALVASLGDIADDESADDVETGEIEATMDVEEINVSLAIELEVRDADRAQPRVTGSTPTQWTETTVMPVFHRLSMRIAQESSG